MPGIFYDLLTAVNFNPAPIQSPGDISRGVQEVQLVKQSRSKEHENLLLVLSFHNQSTFGMQS